MARRLRRPDRRLQDHAQTLDRLELQLKRVLRNRLQQAAALLALQQRALIAVSPAQKLSQQRTQLTALSQRLAHSGRRHLDQGREQLASLSRNLNAVSPLAVLGRGFSISLTESSQVVRQTTDVAPGQTLVTRLADGTVHSSVTETHPNPSDD
jgi:exodeoxyribonuclease VII large subunit